MLDFVSVGGDGFRVQGSGPNYRVYGLGVGFLFLFEGMVQGLGFVV